MDKLAKIETILLKIISTASKNTIVAEIGGKIVHGQPEMKIYMLVDIVSNNTRFICSDQAIDGIMEQMWAALRERARDQLVQAPDFEIDKAYEEALIIDG